MTASARRPGRFGRPLSWARWGTAVSAAAVVALLTLPGGARAQGSGYDPVSGTGQTASGVVVNWTAGLLDANNKPIASAGTELSPNSDRSSPNPTSQLSFMYSDFKNLQVTVSQTQDLTHQGITVSWTGGEPTTIVGGSPGINFLQMMECYGDAATGPTPEQCEYGSAGMLARGQTSDAFIGFRAGNLCTDPNAPPSTSKPPTAGSQPCDTKGASDPAANPPACPLSFCGGGLFDIPFVPVTDPANPDYQTGDTQYFSQFNSNEVQEAVTGSGDSGVQQFNTLTGLEAPGLGCGLPDADNNDQPRGCWLVIVPRGQYEPNGAAMTGDSEFLNTSPLSPSNWAQRIQIHLSFAPAPQFCPLDTQEVQSYGTQLVSRAMQSWELPLNHATNCNKVYSYTAVPESTATGELSDPTTGVGLAMTTIPIGSEATRSGGSPPSTLPPFLYAPVAVSALGFGFNINMTSGYYAKPVKLTPMLMAKALTQSYWGDLTVVNPNVKGLGLPAWTNQSMPQDISHDQQFTNLNPGIPAIPSTPNGPVLTEEHSALTQQVWQWIQGDSAASAWLGGTPDKNDNNMAVNPVYQALNLGQAPAIDNYPRADNGGSPPSQCANFGQGPTDEGKTKPETKCALDLLPYAVSYDSAAASVLAGQHPSISLSWNPSRPAPDGTDGWWDPSPPEPIGGIWLWAATDTSDLTAYGLIPAQLCNDDSSGCVGPTTDSLTAALNSAKPDSSGLLHVDPAHPGNGGYPLTVVTYAAVSTKQSAGALTDYANLIAYAAGQGQTVGSAPGDLPPGYLPMPSSLRAEAQKVVTKLRNLAHPSRSSSSPTNGGTSGTTTPGSTSTQPASTGSTPTRGATSAPTASTTQSPGPVTSLPQVQPAAATTPRQAVGALRWSLVGVAGAGGGAAGGGWLLRSGGIPLWLRRRRPG